MPAEVDAGDPCGAVGQPIRTGLVVRASFDHLGASDVVERRPSSPGSSRRGPRCPGSTTRRCSTASSRASGPRCAEGNELVAVDQAAGAAPEGLELSGARFEVRDAATATSGGRFDLLLAAAGPGRELRPRRRARRTPAPRPLDDLVGRPRRPPRRRCRPPRLTRNWPLTSDCVAL